MGGIGLLIFVILYIWFAIALGKWAHRNLSPRPALAVSILMVILPFVDAIAGRIVLKEKCNQQGSVVLESIQEVKGIGVQGRVYPGAPSYYGYQFVEGGYPYSGHNTPKRLERAEIDPASGVFQVVQDVEPKALYLLIEGDRQDSAYFFQTRTSVKERLTSREIASFNWFAFRGGWAERVAMALSDAGPGTVSSCGDVKDKREMTITLLHSALPPTAPKVQPIPR